MFRILFNAPEIPGNSGNAIRLAAITGAELHLVKPLGFNFEDANLRRAGLDYHDLAVVTVHENLEEALASLGEGRVFAFSSDGDTLYTEVGYVPSDILMFGKESVGLSAADKAHERVTDLVRLPMLPGRRSLNLANAASVVAFEAWRQNGFAGA
ncbi:tRNA (cytidine(34)-2'-O)-methyltransferase [Arthrobacter sp. MYb211]|uniref:tRNA (cytidine(34)-2'-O)-methyltransferase n=1 Tax=Micrococcaceae TaxID=1268 RepID=UPI000BB8AD6A|nr:MULTISPECIES: tRNA (cytidine(34)-2'-O)-methyltransferase [Micrococcaceae]PCC29483.1 tRNA (uridine(34)/cytosine(34)/5-carboxymethylaminomethyluridine(34)-2'-O)-methyltransferase TrmL [Glutamicibacter sp. BW80]PRA01519.1 tRNA (cytidine(34)-2'-O)-methyltransferase [Arthrobacter sp. MYb224]PRA06290.1 tRNA (cytidine(34)-2'-O)-methyltransferase [Arthrobacter sp. MYb229]PRA12774.1 tRNA (cytidine(34)-2'-O)-methyltransferase [Arthrobacter sp. MYb221]PRB53192.1 tRNA (cytidine(34)-2'-O)-methyltransfer